jgi:type IV pilus assembly protein PilY1
MKASVCTFKLKHILLLCRRVWRVGLKSGVCWAVPLCASALTFPTYPLLGGGAPLNSNVLVLYDNSVSMDYELNPSDVFIGGNDPKSRSNISRNILRNLIANYSDQFNWGVEIFNTYGSTHNCLDKDNPSADTGLCGVYTGYEGDSSTMVFTNDCAGGISKSNGGLKCIPNPEPANGYAYITYHTGAVGKSAYFIGPYYKKWSWGMYAVGDSTGNLIDIFDHHNNVTSWNIGDDNSTAFSSVNDFSIPTMGAGTNPHSWYGCIDAGNGNCVTSKEPRLLYMNDGWVFMQNFSGMGKISEPISVSSVSHNKILSDLMASETPNINSKEIKNASFQTPLMGSFITAKQYYSGLYNGYNSPINSKCQQNYVLLTTDGWPTADSSGNVYPISETVGANTGKAFTDLYPQVSALRNVNFNGDLYDIKTFVLGMGDVLNNPDGVNGLNNMAQQGGTEKAYMANDELSMSLAFNDIVDRLSRGIPLRQSNGRIALSLSRDASKTNVYKATFSNANINVWQGNLIKSTPQLFTPASGLVNYTLGDITDFNTGAAGLLKNNMINGHSRQIITGVSGSSKNGVRGVPFLWDTLDASAQKMMLNPSDNASVGQSRVNYIRGDRSNERSATNMSGFRKRDITVLGDIIDSSPLFVGPSLGGYSDSDFSSKVPSFKSFYQSVLSRQGMVYVGANDGMLHGFNADSLEEIFAFIPNSVLSKVKSLSASTYRHDFYVNASPLVADAVIPSRGWSTELIGFCGNGGTGLFALDITSPDNTKPSISLNHAEANAKNIVLWELNSAIDRDIGYIINQGQINRGQGGLSMQQAVMSNGRPAIVVGNGYNSPNNTTGLFVVYLDVEGGKPAYKKIMIPGVQGGLSTPTVIDMDYDGVADYAYAGDLQGNIWRFDLRDKDDKKWKAPFKLFQVVDSKSAKVVPITTAPSVSLHCSQLGLLVVVGTGKYLEADDNKSSYADGHADYLIGLLDKRDITSSTFSDMLNSPKKNNSPIKASDLVMQSYLQGSFVNTSPSPNNVAGSLLLTTDNKVDWNSGKRGWMLQLYNETPNSARIIVPPYTYNGVLYFNTISPGVSSSCDPSNVVVTAQALNACTGQPPQDVIFDLNYDGVADTSDQYNLDGKLINVTGVNLKNQGRILDSSVWLKPSVFQCTTPPCGQIQTDYEEPLGVSHGKSVMKRLTWKERI